MSVLIWAAILYGLYHAARIGWHTTFTPSRGDAPGGTALLSPRGRPIRQNPDDDDRTVYEQEIGAIVGDSGQTLIEEDAHSWPLHHGPGRGTPDPFPPARP